MKRPDIWIALVGGCAAGLVAGFLVAYAIFDGEPNAAARPALDAYKPSGENPLAPNLADARSSDVLSGAELLRGERLQNAVLNSLRMPRPLDQAQLLAVIQNLRKEDFPAVLEVLRKAKTGIHMTSQDGQGPLAWIAFWQRFGELDPHAALVTALQCGDLQYTDRQVLEKHLFTGMARSDPLQAAKLFLDHPELPNRQAAAEGLMHAWSSKDPATALKWARENLDDVLFARAPYAITWGAANAQSEYPDITRAISISKTIPDSFKEPSLRALKDMVSKRAYISAQDSLAAVTFMREIGKRDPMFESLVVRKVMSSDPAAAASYFAQPLADNSIDVPQLNLVATMWAAQDFRAAEAWGNDQKGASHYGEIAKVLWQAAVNRGDQDAIRRWTGAKEAADRAEAPAGN